MADIYGANLYNRKLKESRKYVEKQVRHISYTSYKLYVI